MHDRDLVVAVEWVVGADLGSETILQRSDDLSSGCVVLGIGGENHEEVQGHTDGIPLHLNIPLLEDVEETHLNLPGQIRKLVDGEHPAVGARDEPVVQGELVGQVAALGHLDGVDLAEQIIVVGRLQNETGE